MIKCRYVKTDMFVKVGSVPLKFVLLVCSVWRTHESNMQLGFDKKAVSAFSYSWKKRREMAEVGLPTYQLVTESPTRWGSCQKMIERFLEQEEAIVRVLGSDKRSCHPLPTWQDLEVLESVNKVVKPLQDFTDALPGESYVCVSCIKPVLCLFRTSLLQRGAEDTELTAT